MSNQIVDFRTPISGESSTPEADKLIAGEPHHIVANFFSDTTQQFHSGIWASTRGKWRIQYKESEFCCLTRGRVALENLLGERWEFGPGEAFVVPSGFTGTWEVIKDCTKFYVIFEPRT